MKRYSLRIQLSSLVAAGCLLSGTALQAATLRVDISDPDATDAGGCGSQVMPCRSIQAAINAAVSGDEILVAAGTYTHDAGLEPAECNDSTAVACAVNKELTIRGGFTGGDWVEPDPVAGPTIIDGQDQKRGVLIKRGSPVAPSASLQLEGFTIRRGRADRSVPDGDDAFGGGFSAVLVDRITLRDLVVEDNAAVGVDTGTAGGAGRGGGVSIRGGEEFITTVALDRVTVVGNLAGGGRGDVRGGRAVGGGLFLKDIQELSSTDLVVRDNSAQGGPSSGNGLFGGLRSDALGGGIGMLDCDSVAFRRLTVTGNETLAGDPGGLGGTGGNAFGGGVYGEASTIGVVDGEISGNRAQGGSALSGSPSQPATGGLGAGGGFASFVAAVTLDQVKVIDNRAVGGSGPIAPADGVRGQVGGGGGYFEETEAGGSGRVDLVNSVFAENFAEIGTGSGGSGGGGGIFLLGIEATMTHVSIADNDFNDPLLGGTGVVANTRRLGFPDAAPSNVVTKFSIVSGHDFPGEQALRINEDSALSFGSRATVFAANSQDTGGLGLVTDAGALQHVDDVRFLSPGAPEFDYRLAEGSPAIDQAVGSSTFADLEGQKRGRPADLGADEVCLSSVENLLLADQVVVGIVREEACSLVSVRNYSIESGADVSLVAGVAVIFEDGFVVRRGSELMVENRLP